MTASTSGTPSLASEALLPIYRRPPAEFVRGDGVWLVDADGRRYLDFTAGIAVNALGYGDPQLRDALVAALDTGLIHVSNLFRSPPAEGLAAWLVEHSFASSVFFCNSGAEANEAAFKFARRWGRAVGGGDKHHILGVRGGFHGRLFASLAATDRPQYRAPFCPLAGGVGIADRGLEELDAALVGDTVAALIVEPVQGEGGIRVMDAGWLREVRALTRERRIALIFDEIQCGLGRTGSLFAYEQTGVEPDMLTLAKPLAGGLPMGATLLTAEIAATIQPGDHATTFGGGPLVASVALHVVRRIGEPSFLASVRENGEWLGEALAQLGQRCAAVQAVRGVGYLWGIDVDEPAGDVVRRALDAGLLVCSAGERTIRLVPPLVMTREELGQGIALLEKVLSR